MIEDGADLNSPRGEAPVDLIAEFERAQEALAKLRVALQKLLGQLAPGEKPSRLSESLRRLMASVGAVYDAIEEARWTIMEREADDDLAAGRVGPTFANAADLITHLNA